MSLPHWNDDEELGASFAGRHAMVVGGYSQVVGALGQGIDVRLGTPVAQVRICSYAA